MKTYHCGFWNREDERHEPLSLFGAMTTVTNIFHSIYSSTYVDLLSTPCTMVSTKILCSNSMIWIWVHIIHQIKLCFMESTPNIYLKINDLAQDLLTSIKVIHPKYSKHGPYTVAHTIDCVCSKMLNHCLNHGLFLSLFKLIPCPIHWIVYVLAYLNFILEF